MQRPFHAALPAWETRSVTQPLDIQAIRDSLRRIMDRKSVKPTTLSQQVGSSKTLVKDLLEKTDDIKLSTLIKLAGALDVDIEELLSRPAVAIAGGIGAGGQIMFEDVGETLAPDQTVPRPPSISGELIALVVRGASMLPKYRDGDIIYIQRNHDGVLKDYVGEDCAIRLASGETFLKQLTAGTRPGLFTLRSLNADDMVDQDVSWASPVLFVMPAKSRERFG